MSVSWMSRVDADVLQFSYFNVKLASRLLRRKNYDVTGVYFLQMFSKRDVNTSVCQYKEILEYDAMYFGT
jgi:hypothetical protein